jgi:hypothetical protein
MSQILHFLAKERQEEASGEVPLFLAAREIKSLFHFTHFENLDSIFQYGLLGKGDLDRKRINYQVTDSSRQEPIENGICCSIGTVNKYMLTRKVNSSDSQLVLLELSPVETLLQNKNYLAIPGNFGRNIHKVRIQQFPEEYIGAKGLLNLFLNEPIREKYNLHRSEPTDPQSEIVFLESIESSSIKRLVLPPGASMHARTAVERFLLDTRRDLIVELDNKSKFRMVLWNASETVEFHERKWSEEWS